MALFGVLVLISILAFLIYKWSIAKYNVLKERGVPHDKPSPFIGNLGMKMMRGQNSLFKLITELHLKYKHSKVYGFYNMRDALILVNDAELLKKIGVKDFDNFMNHKTAFNTDEESVLNKSLLVLRDRKWKEMRNTLTPSFTGSKMRQMFELINECCLAGVNYLEGETKANINHEVELDIQDFFTRFTNDVIASAAFGIKVNSFQDKENDFYKIGNIVTQFKGIVLLKAMLLNLMPKLMKLLGLKIFHGKYTNYFKYIYCFWRLTDFELYNMALLEFIILFAIVLFLIYKWLTAKFGILRELNIPHDKPLPLIGSLKISIFLGKTSLFKSFMELHARNKNNKVYGMYMFRSPIFVINDSELIKKIAIKDFDNFINHKDFFPDDGGAFSRSLVVLKDHEWKTMRNTLTPTFTGSKMRLMYGLINECCIEGIKYLESEAKAMGGQGYDLEMKDFFTRFTNDVIASSAFGIKINSFEDKENDFFKIGGTITKLAGRQFWMFVFHGLMPKLAKALQVRIFDVKSVNYFSQLVLNAINYRQKNNIVRPDMIHLLLEAKRNLAESKAELPDLDIVAQCLIFFFAGFDTVSNCLCFTLHELMENQEVQEKLYAEILDVQEKLNGAPLNYDALMKMKYMDMVLSESLRKWPPIPNLERGCSKDYDLTDEDGNLVLKLRKDDNVWILTVGLHHDPENFENPAKFDPERFSEENKDKIKPQTYMPFGIGPRNCIGNRLALMETKSIIYHILLKFKVTATARTAKDAINSLDGFNLVPKEKFWIKIVERNN